MMLAKILIQLSLFNSLLSLVTCELLESSYIKTRTIEENKGCVDEEDYFHRLQDRQAVSLISCARLCSTVDQCRRFMFNLQTRTCSLYRSGQNCLSAESVDSKLCYRQKSLCNETTCVRCPLGYYGNECQYIIQDCSDGARKGVVPERNLRSFIKPGPQSPPVEVKCDFKWRGLTYILSRKTICREVDFNRSWGHYSEGFGTISANHWLGLSPVHQILQNHAHFSLTVLLKLSGINGPYQGHYNRFNMTDNLSNYSISLYSFHNNSQKGSGDSFTGTGYDITGRPFSTYDKDHTIHNCPGRFHGGWWYLDNEDCSRANLVGLRTGSSFEETWHWQDVFGNVTDFSRMEIYIKRE